MIETEDSIQTTLDLLGTTLLFQAVPIKGIPEQKLSDISDYGSPFEVVKNSYSFLLSMKDLKAINILEGTNFTMQILHRKFTFSAGNYTEDFSGWVKLFATLVGVEDV